MEIIDIIEGLNRYYESFNERDRGQFILHKVIEDNPIVKSQKMYEVSIWYVKEGYKEKIIQQEAAHRVVTELEFKQMESEIISSIIYSLLEFTNSIKFKNMCNGKYSC